MKMLATLIISIAAGLFVGWAASQVNQELLTEAAQVVEGATNHEVVLDY